MPQPFASGGTGALFRALSSRVAARLEDRVTWASAAPRSSSESLYHHLGTQAEERGVDFCAPTPPLEPQDPQKRQALAPGGVGGQSAASAAGWSEGSVPSTYMLTFGGGFGGGFLMAAVGIFLGLSARRKRSQRTTAAPSSRGASTRVEVRPAGPSQPKVNLCSL